MRKGYLSDEKVLARCPEYQSLTFNKELGAKTTNGKSYLPQQARYMIENLGINKQVKENMIEEFISKSQRSNPIDLTVIRQNAFIPNPGAPVPPTPPSSPSSISSGSSVSVNSLSGYIPPNFSRTGSPPDEPLGDEPTRSDNVNVGGYEMALRREGRSALFAQAGSVFRNIATPVRTGIERIRGVLPSSPRPEIRRRTPTQGQNEDSNPDANPIAVSIANALENTGVRFRV